MAEPYDATKPTRLLRREGKPDAEAEAKYTAMGFVNAKTVDSYFQVDLGPGMTVQVLTREPGRYREAFYDSKKEFVGLRMGSQTDGSTDFYTVDKEDTELIRCVLMGNDERASEIARKSTRITTEDLVFAVRNRLMATTVVITNRIGSSARVPMKSAIRAALHDGWIEGALYMVTGTGFEIDTFEFRKESVQNRYCFAPHLPSPRYPNVPILPALTETQFTERRKQFSEMISRYRNTVRILLFRLKLPNDNLYLILKFVSF